MSDYTPTTEEVRMAYVGEPEHWLDDKVAAEFDRWFASEIEKAARIGAEEALRIVKEEWFPDED